MFDLGELSNMDVLKESVENHDSKEQHVKDLDTVSRIEKVSLPNEEKPAENQSVPINDIFTKSHVELASLEDIKVPQPKSVPGPSNKTNVDADAIEKTQKRASRQRNKSQSFRKSKSGNNLFQ